MRLGFVRRRRAKRVVSLPIELWGRVFSFLDRARDLSAVSQVCTRWHGEVFSKYSDGLLWRGCWDGSVSEVDSTALCVHHRVGGEWQLQVRASCLLRSLRAIPGSVTYLPPRYRRHADDALAMSPVAVDLEDTLGRALCAQAGARDVVIGFENGVGVLCLCGKGRVLYYDATRGVQVMVTSSSTSASARTGSGNSGDASMLCATSRSELALLDLGTRWHRSAIRRPLQWRILDDFSSEDGTLVSLLALPDIGLHVAGFDNGRVRVSCEKTKQCRYVLSMRESADMLAASERYLIAACHMQPIGVAVWDLRDGRALQRLDQASVGWEEVTQLAGVTRTRNTRRFALWDGKCTVRLLDVVSGTFVRTIRVRGYRARVCGGEVSTPPSAHVGRGRVALSNDQRTLICSSADRAFVVGLDNIGVPAKRIPVAGGGRALVALSSDENSVVTADTDAFGGLGTWISAGNARHALRIWDARTGALRSEWNLPAAADHLSVAANVVSVVVGKLGQVLVLKYE